MPLMEHIRELRNRVFMAALAVLAGAIIGYIFFNPVWHFLEGPYCRIPQPNRLNGGDTCQLYFNGIFDTFFLRLKLAVIVGVIISSPMWFYQLWAFIAPGLRRRERKWGYFFVASAVPLFVGGAVLAYFTMDKALNILLVDLAPHDTVALITINSYLKYVVSMVAIFGVAFELPLLVVLLNAAGILTHARIAKWRRGLIFVIFCFAAVATPSPDPLTMCILALPTVALFEVAELVAYLHDKRKAAREADDDYADLDDDEPTPLNLADR